jgi:hypothetical protein
MDGVQCFREAGAEAPTNGCLCVNSGCSTCSQNASNTSILNDGTTIHEVTPKEEIRHKRDKLKNTSTIVEM